MRAALRWAATVQAAASAGGHHLAGTLQGLVYVGACVARVGVGVARAALLPAPPGITPTVEYQTTIVLCRRDDQSYSTTCIQTLFLFAVFTAVLYYGSNALVRVNSIRTRFYGGIRPH